jgi:hypothetical protein
MSKKKEFYIGWQDEMPQKNKRFLRNRLLWVAIIIPLLALAFVLVQKPFSNAWFEFGKERGITGTYIDQPIPMLIAEEGALPEGLSKEILLVGYGKFRARGIMDNIQEKVGSLHGKTLTMNGTLIYGDGKTLMELTEKEESLSKVLGDGQAPNMDTQKGPSTSLRGEIIDPKCYFGVMKPGEGKIHKSCAIGCISGGIPPVLRTKTDDDRWEYYLVLGEQKQSIHKEVLSFVAEPVSVEGSVGSLPGWKVIFINPQTIEQLHP